MNKWSQNGEKKTLCHVEKGTLRQVKSLKSSQQDDLRRRLTSVQHLTEFSKIAKLLRFK